VEAVSDLTDAEVTRYLTELERLPATVEQESTIRRVWYWLGDKSRSWSPAKSCLFMTGAMMVVVTVLVLLEEWVKVFAILALYLPLAGVFCMAAIFESERPNGRAGMVSWSNERAGWGPPR
jgi:multidrug efflux pump subunit AcrB